MDEIAPDINAFYLDLAVVDRQRAFDKAQFAADTTRSPQVIHPHKHGEDCGDLLHYRFVPYETDPFPVKIATDFGGGRQVWRSQP